MIRNLLLSILFLFIATPVKAVTSLSLQIESGGKIMTADTVDICDGELRTLKFIVNTDASDDNIELGLFVPGDDTTNYFIKANNELGRETKKIITTKFDEDFAKNTYNVGVKIEGAFNIVNKKLKIWNCRVPIKGALFQDKDFNVKYNVGYTLNFGDQKMDVNTSNGEYTSKLDNGLLLHKSYQPDFGGILNELVNERFSFTVSSPDEIIRNYWVDPWRFASEPKMSFECGDSDEKLHMKINFLSELTKIRQIIVKIGSEEIYNKTYSEAEAEVPFKFEFDHIISDKIMEGQEVVLSLANELEPTKLVEFPLGKVKYWSCEYMWFQADKGGILANMNIKNSVKNGKSMCTGGLVAAPSIDAGKGEIGTYFKGGDKVVSLKDLNKMIENYPGFDVTREGEKVISSDPRADGINVVVAPSIRITRDVLEINAILIAYGGDIIIDTDSDRKQQDSQLVINGSLISKGDIVIKRDMANNASNGNTEPVVKVNFVPKYLFELPNGLLEVLGDWKMGT